MSDLLLRDRDGKRIQHACPVCRRFITMDLLNRFVEHDSNNRRCEGSGRSIPDCKENRGKYRGN